MRVRLTETARGVAPSDALRWWRDFREGRHDHGFVHGVERRILAHGHDSGVVMEDRMRLVGVPVWREHTRAWVEGEVVRFHGVNALARFEGSYRFEAAEGGAAAGTRVTLDARVELRGPLRWTTRIARPVVDKILAHDLRGHAREMERDVAAPP